MRSWTKRINILKGFAVVGCLFLLHPVLAEPPTTAETNQPAVFCLRGTVRNAEGKPVAGAIVRTAGTIGLGKATVGPWHDVTDADGGYSLSYTRDSTNMILVTGFTVEAPGFIRLSTQPQWDVTMQHGKPGEPNEFVFRLQDGEIDLRAFLMPNNDVIRFEGKGAASVTVLQANLPAKHDIVLTRGEILAGSIHIPTSFPYRVAEQRAEDRQFQLTIHGPSFNEVYQSEKGGHFQIWVPKGVYALELALDTSSSRLENVVSGTENVQWNIVDPMVPKLVIVPAFDAIWTEMDQHYSYFELKKVNWMELRQLYRPLAVRATTAGQFVDVLLEMFGKLRDGHVWVDLNGAHGYPTFSPRKRVENYNPEVIKNSLENLNWCEAFAGVAKTKGDGFGVFLMEKQSAATEASVQEAVNLIRSLHDVPGFIVDLRNSNGGDELLARKIAQEFCGQDTIYAKSKYREGSKHDDFGNVYDRTLEASKDPFLKPVVCLIGSRCVSSGEGFAQMMSCLPNVTTIGEPTRGSSGNPRSFKVPEMNLAIYYSSWVDMMPDETPIEDAGVIPKIRLDFPQDAYEGRDPTWEKAAAVLRELTKTSLEKK